MSPDADAILLRTSDGAKLRTAWERSVVAFEVDDYDPEDHTGWSVLVQGRSRVITDGREVLRDLSAPLQPWADPMAGYFVEISCDRVSGRRVGRRIPYRAPGSARPPLRRALGTTQSAAPPAPVPSTSTGGRTR